MLPTLVGGLIAADNATGEAGEMPGLAPRNDAELLEDCLAAMGPARANLAAALELRGDQAAGFAKHVVIGLRIARIVRDWRTDAARGCVRIPRNRLRRSGLKVEDVLRGPPPVLMRRVLGGLLALGERHFRSAEAALAAVPLRHRWTTLRFLRTARLEARRVVRGRPGALPWWNRVALQFDASAGIVAPWVSRRHLATRSSLQAASAHRIAN
jgi:hypothetical protein